MIEPGDRILVGVSGGKDSMTLLNDLIKRQKSFPIKYEFEALHIISDFSNYDEALIENKLKELNVKYHILKINILQRLKKNEKMNCYWCSIQRRIELIKYAKQNGFNKIALGHHMDDIIETFLMNIFFKCEIATMLPIFKYKKYPLSIIRPLCRVKVKDIIKFAKEKDFYGMTCSCSYNSNSKRLEVREMIESMSKKNKNIRDNIFKAMKNINNEYLL